MKKFFKIVSIVLVVLVIAIAGVLTYINAALPNVGDPPELKVEATADQIARGKYLANSVTVCMDCHSTRDWTKFSGPITTGTSGKGGERFDHTVGFPGVYYSKNITPAGIGRYSDGELFRVITTGVNKDGNAMFPVMPYPYYGKMANEDVHAIIAYIRTLEPIENPVTDSESDFPMNFILNTIPSKGEPMKRPDPADELANGAYLVTIGACVECHTYAEKGQIDRTMEYAGGRAFQLPDGSTVTSSNITPDVETGIGNYTKEAFIQRFKMYADSTYTPPPVAPGEFNTIMPWTMYANMTTDDLGAIYAYLRTIKPIKNKVVKFTPPAGQTDR
jgi:mono/diheme cytochrome c family protein